MDKILIGIPVLYNAAIFNEAIESVVYKENVELLIINNGADDEVKNIISKYYVLENVEVIWNEGNKFVNFAWNQIIQYFLDHPEYDRLIIMNSDIVMNENWDGVVRNRWMQNKDEILLPVIGELKEVNSDVASAQKVTSGTPGVFITLNRRQAKIIYPIPNVIRIWFGDNYIYDILRGIGYETLIPENLLAKHYESSTVSKVLNVSEIIEDDKIAYKEIVKPKIEKMIQFINSRKTEV